MIRKTRFFAAICFFTALAIVFTGCAHPWRLASNPYTPIPSFTENPDPLDTSAPDASAELPTADASDSMEPTEEPTDIGSVEPTEVVTEAPSGTASGTTPTPSGSTEAPTTKPTDKPTEKPTEKPTARPTQTPEPDIPPFSTGTINNMGNFDNSMFAEAEVTMINVWATTCGPCIQELPHIQELSSHYASQGLNVVTILGDSEQPGCIAVALNIINGLGFNLPVLRYNNSTANAFPAGAYPTTYFIDSNGNILRVVTTSNTFEGWCDIIDDLL